MEYLVVIGGALALIGVIYLGQRQGSRRHSGTFDRPTTPTPPVPPGPRAPRGRIKRTDRDQRKEVT